jgi:hypothetical protein
MRDNGLKPLESGGQRGKGLGRGNLRKLEGRIVQGFEKAVKGERRQIFHKWRE